MAWLGGDRVSNTLDWVECIYTSEHIVDDIKIILYYGDLLVELFMGSGRSVWSTVSVGVYKCSNTMNRHNMFWKEGKGYNFTPNYVLI